MSGVPRRMLRVDLTTGSVTSEAIPEHWQRLFLGGKGLGARYLYAELAAGVDPLGPDNCLLFCLGPLSGRLPGETRYAAITKSPLTGGFLDSYSGGTFADRLVGALGNHMGLLITGRAPELSVLRVADGTAQLHPAPQLAGADAVELADYAGDSAVAGIGPAGEHQVAYATIASDGGEHQAGRGGAGAVMGAKNLKAVIADGTPPTTDSAVVDRYQQQYRESDVGRWQTASGTVETVDFADTVGVLPAYGWQEGSFEHAEEIGIEAVTDATTERERDAPMPGGFRIDMEDGTFVPRGATAMSLGAELGIAEFDAVASLGQACDRLGIDVISAGNAIAWAVLAANRGIIDRSLSFGDTTALKSLLEAIATRDGQLGDTLADGIEAAEQAYGTEGLVPTVKAMDTPPYDPRGSPAMALAYATSDRGACHRRALPVETEALDRDQWTTEDRVRSVISEQTTNAVLWSLVSDSFAGDALSADLGAELLDSVGLDYTPDTLLTLGERVWTLTRLFNVREGFDREDDTLPYVFTQPLGSGPVEGETVDPSTFSTLLDLYYHLRGWSRAGRPTRQLLERLDIDDLPDAATPIDATIASYHKPNRQ